MPKFVYHSLQQTDKQPMMYSITAQSGWHVTTRSLHSAIRTYLLFLSLHDLFCLTVCSFY